MNKERFSPLDYLDVWLWEVIFLSLGSITEYGLRFSGSTGGEADSVEGRD